MRLEDSSSKSYDLSKLDEENEEDEDDHRQENQPQANDESSIVESRDGCFYDEEDLNEQL